MLGHQGWTPALQENISKIFFKKSKIFPINFSLREYLHILRNKDLYPLEAWPVSAPSGWTILTNFSKYLPGFLTGTFENGILLARIVSLLMIDDVSQLQMRDPEVSQLVLVKNPFITFTLLQFLMRQPIKQAPEQEDEDRDSDATDRIYMIWSTVVYRSCHQCTVVFVVT